MNLEQHPGARLEYWFFKVNYQQTALLVDWIARRNVPSGVVRVSIHSPLGREVVFIDHPAILQNGAPELTLAATTWKQGSIGWDLALTTAPDRIWPQIFPAEQLKLFDMSLESAPRVTFNGWIEYRGERFQVVEAPGMLSHYWGRGLPREWWWISANQFQNREQALECTLLQSSLWGSAAHMPLGYLYYRDAAARSLLIAPPARLSVAGTPEAFEVTATAIGGRRLTLKARGREYASLGDGISNTLAGDLEVWEAGRLVAQTLGSAGLERRARASG